MAAWFESEGDVAARSSEVVACYHVSPTIVAVVNNEHVAGTKIRPVSVVDVFRLESHTLMFDHIPDERNGAVT